jgi:hypothetical protein
MSFDYLAAQVDALGILAEFGQRITVSRPVLTGADPADPQAGSLTATSAEVIGAVLPVSRGRVGMGVGDTVIRAEDVTIYAAHDIAFVPQENDQFVTAQGTYRALGADAIAPAGITVAYEITARR